MRIVFVKELPVTRAGASQALVRTDEPKPRYFVVSTIHTQFNYETLVFPAYSTGTLVNYLEVAGYEGASRADALDDLASVLGISTMPEETHGRKFRTL